MGDREHRNWQLWAGAALVALSAALYGLHYLIFRDAHHLFIYMLGELAFLPLEVLFVTLILHKLLEEREKKARLHKMNMVIGTFFSEVGSDLLRALVAIDQSRGEMEGRLARLAQEPKADLGSLARSLRPEEFRVDCPASDLPALREFVREKRDFLLRLLENPNLLEHEGFTEVLWAVFHISDELSTRRDVAHAPEPDRKHLMGDLNRAYGLLAREWLFYMAHLKRAYPFLFSLALRLNPFDPQASAEVTA